MCLFMVMYFMVSVMCKFTKSISLNFIYKGKWSLVLYFILGYTFFLLNFPSYEVFKVVNSWVTLDNTSTLLLMLSSFLLLLMLLSSTNIILENNFDRVYKMFLLVLLISLFLSFMVNNFLYFYFWFEMSLIPTLFIVMGWGYQPERLQAGVYFMMYTLLASLPLLFSLMYMGYKSESMSMLNLFLYSNLISDSLSSDFFLFLMAFILIMAFLVKLPMFFVHLWLPKAHVEAPVAGSMILAGVLLKLGGYGLMRLIMKFNFLLKFGYLFTGLSLVGMVYIGYVCCRLNDLKALVAYSSVAHMSLVIVGVFSGLNWGFSGALLLMVSHGISSSGLFCFVNMIYERVSSRSLYINKGVINFLPVFTMLMFLLCGSNISAPPSINLLSEIILFISIYYYDFMTLVLLPMGSFLGAVFTFYLFSLSHHGKIFNSLVCFSESKNVELHVLVLHLIPVYTLVLKSELFMS